MQDDAEVLFDSKLADAYDRPGLSVSHRNQRLRHGVALKGVERTRRGSS